MSHPRILLFNASPHTGNLGVSALCRTVVESLGQRIPDAEIAIASHRPVGALKWDVPDSVQVKCVPFFPKTHRHWIDGSRFRTRLSRFIPGVGGRFGGEFGNATAVLDISGGDSFTDLYGDRVWEAIQFPKLLAMQDSRPLILLPQTVGPFEDPAKKAAAAEMIQYSRLACSRDAGGFAALQEMSDLNGVGENERLINGVDMAFLLQPVQPDQKTAGCFARIRDNSATLVGLNVSGLVWFAELRARQRGDSHGIDVQYRQVMKKFVEEVVSEDGCQVLLMPHVLAMRGSFESDTAASEDLCEMISPSLRERVHVLSGSYDESEIKWAIAQCDWFSGARMHPTIAGLSSEVPTLNLAYSIKARGVFDTASQGHSLADLRNLDDAEVLSTMLTHFNSRSYIADELKESIPRTISRAQSQADQIANVIRST
ncbi:polysaccharide pyruvyl transferase family protein [Phycisphaerales bacterium]|nr:polysaccharide pyruvyl transferase family protein [Phycisphaerales bacterium]